MNLLVNENNMDQKNKVLVKGSRSAHMEIVVEDILNWHTTQQKQDQLLSDSTINTNKQDNT